MDTFVWLLAFYARYFAAVFIVGLVLFCILWLLTFRSHSRTSPDPNGTNAV